MYWNMFLTSNHLTTLCYRQLDFLWKFFITCNLLVWCHMILILSKFWRLRKLWLYVMVFALKVFGKIIKMMMLLNGGRTWTQEEEFSFYIPNNDQVCPMDNVLSRMKWCMYRNQILEWRSIFRLYKTFLICVS